MTFLGIFSGIAMSISFNDFISYIKERRSKVVLTTCLILFSVIGVNWIFASICAFLLFGLLTFVALKLLNN